MPDGAVSTTPDTVLSSPTVTKLVPDSGVEAAYTVCAYLPLTAAVMMSSVACTPGRQDWLDAACKH